ncbi:MAG: helix-turn-helix domain-containing protein [Armatimonadota bacterium]
MSSSIKVTESSGNVFEDIGLLDAEEALARADLALRISDIITERGLTQAAAARILEIDQPKVSALICGRLEGLSTDRLLRFLNALGSDVQIAINPD